MKTKLIVHACELTEKWIDRMLDAGIDVLGIHSEGGQNAHEFLERNLKLFEQPGYRKLIDYAKSKGMKIHYELHAASYLLPRELFSDRPQMFRMDADKKRNPDVNLCPSSSEALDLVCKRAAELTSRLYGSSDEYFLWLDDVRDGKCHCEKCRSLSSSDQNLTVMNAIVRALRKTNPNASVAFLAYYSTFETPKKITPEKGIFLEYAPYTRYIDRPYDKTGLDEKYFTLSNGETPSSRYLTQPADTMDKATIDETKRLLSFFGKETAWALEYWYDNSMFSRCGCTPRQLTPNDALIKRDLEFYRSLDFGGVSSFACYLGDEYERLYNDEISLSAIKK